MLKLKVLIVDDEVDYCGIMRSYFQKRDYTVFISHNLKEGLSLLESAKPDILLLDNNLPDGKGWSYLDTIMNENPSLKIFLVSAYYRKEDSLDAAVDQSRIVVWEKPLSLSLLNDHF